MDTFIEIIKLIDWIAFVILLLPVTYFACFGFSALFKSWKKSVQKEKVKRFLVIFPAYKEDKVIVQSVKSFLLQTYPKDHYRLCVVSDHMQEETNRELSTLDIQLLKPTFEKSLKAKALQYAISKNSDKDFDMVIIMDADNIVENDFLKKLNIYSGQYKAVQCHRTAKNTNSPTAVLDAVSEEIANSIFRKGHRNLGFSSALIGSGMAFDFKWFSQNVELLTTSGEDKEIEKLLLKERIKIEYLDDLFVYDEKTQKSGEFYNQRRRWIATRLFSLFDNIKEFFPALFSGNIDYFDKLFQWILPSRVVTAGLLFIIAAAESLVRFHYAIKWWGVLLYLTIVLIICIPRRLLSGKLLKALFQIPLLFIMMVANLFRIKGTKKEFIHTEKGFQSKNNMRIAIEAQHIFKKQKHGMDMVVLECVRELQKIDFENEYFIMVAPGEDMCLNETENFHIIEIKGNFHPIWEQISLPLALKKIKPDYVHCTSNTAPIFCKYPLIVTLHDIIFLEKKRGTSKSRYQRLGRIYRRLVVPIIVPKAKKIITVSDFELNNIRQKMNLPADKIIRIYNGMGDRFRHIDNYLEITSEYFSDTDYILFLGNTDPKKNTIRTLKAYSLYASSVKSPLPLVIVDLDEEYIMEMISQNGINPIIIPLLRITGYISNFDLPAIYSGASLFLYPSLRESFGIPVLESMACHTPVITSSTSALPEICADAAFLVNPEDENEMAKAIEKIESDSELRNILIEAGEKRFQYFTWEKTAKETKALYDSLIKGE